MSRIKGWMGRAGQGPDCVDVLGVVNDKRENSDHSILFLDGWLRTVIEKKRTSGRMVQ